MNDTIKLQISMEKALSNYFLDVLKIARECGGTAYQIHDSITVQIPEEHMVRAMGKINCIKLDKINCIKLDKINEADLDEVIIIRFYGIDSWNRPVFKRDGCKSFYGATDILFDQWVTEWEVLKKVTEKDITWFGDYFSCEPMGSYPGKIVIKRRNE